MVTASSFAGGVVTHDASAATEHNANRFHLLRLLAAVAVLLSHGEFLYHLSLTVPFTGHSIGSLAVYCFFFVSGYLVFQSWERQPEWGAFWIKRVARVFPGLVVATAFAVFVVGWAMTRLPAAEYWTHPDTWRNFFDNASGVALVLGLPGVFESNPATHTVNGSLWTIRYELLMYLLLSIIGFAGGLQRRWVFPVGVLLMACWWITGRSGGGVPMPGWLSHWFTASDVSALGVLFLLGCSCAAYRVRPRLWMLLVAVCGVWLAISAATAFGVQIGVWILVAAGTMWLAHAGAPRWTGFPRDDLSYGIYIYAFPIQQAVTEICLNRGWSLGICLVISLGLTCAMAAFSWHCVARPCIRHGRHLIRRFFWGRALPSQALRSEVR